MKPGKHRLHVDDKGNIFRSTRDVMGFPPRDEPDDDFGFAYLLIGAGTAGAFVLAGLLIWCLR